METMTVKEVADILGVEVRTINHHIANLFPGLAKNGVPTRLNEEHITRIKEKMIPSNALLGAVTDLEMFERAMSVQTWAMAKIQEQKLALEAAQPKIEFHDAVTESDSCFGMSQAVKILNLTLGRNHFYTLLKADGIVNSDREPYQKYIDDGYFRVTVKPLPNGKTQTVTLVTGKGLAWLQKRYDHIRLREVV